MAKVLNWAIIRKDGEKKSQHCTQTSKGLFDFLLYFGLLIFAFLSIKQSYMEYTSKKTTYSQMKEPLTEFDIPTLTFCFVFDLSWDVWDKGLQLVHGQNFSTSVKATVGGKISTMTIAENGYFDSITIAGRGYFKLLEVAPKKTNYQ